MSISDTKGSLLPERRFSLKSIDLAILAVVVAPAIAAGVEFFRRYEPTGDRASIAQRTLDVFTLHPPLVGQPSAASDYTAVAPFHPGPFQNIALAPLGKLLGPGSAMIVGGALWVALWCGAAVWLARRCRADGLTMLLAASIVVLQLSTGTERLVDPWNPYAATWPFLALLIGVWAVGCGVPIALPVVAVAFSAVLQMHLSYVFLAPSLVAVAGCFALRNWWNARADHGAAKNWRRSIIGSILLSVLCWLPPIVQQLSSEHGNFTALIDGSQGTNVGHLDPMKAAQVIASTVALPPWWLRPSIDVPRVDLAGVAGHAWFAISSLVAVLICLGWTAVKPQSPRSPQLAITLLVALGAGVVTAWRAPISFLAIFPHYVSWLWPLGAVVATLIVHQCAASLPPVREWVESIRVSYGGRSVGGRAYAMIGVISLGLLISPGPVVTPDVSEVVRTLGVGLEHNTWSGPVCLGEAAVDGLDDPAFSLEQWLQLWMVDNGLDVRSASDRVVRNLGEHRRDRRCEQRRTLVVASGSLAEPHLGQESTVASMDRFGAGRRARKQELLVRLRLSIPATGGPAVSEHAQLGLKIAQLQDPAGLSRKLADPEYVLGAEGRSFIKGGDLVVPAALRSDVSEYLRLADLEQLGVAAVFWQPVPG